MGSRRRLFDFSGTVEARWPNPEIKMSLTALRMDCGSIPCSLFNRPDFHRDSVA